MELVDAIQNSGLLVSGVIVLGSLVGVTLVLQVGPTTRENCLCSVCLLAPTIVVTRRDGGTKMVTDLN